MNETPIEALRRLVGNAIADSLDTVRAGVTDYSESNGVATFDFGDGTDYRVDVTEFDEPAQQYSSGETPPEFSQEQLIEMQNRQMAMSTAVQIMDTSDPVELVRGSALLAAYLSDGTVPASDPDPLAASLAASEGVSGLGEPPVI